MVISDLEKAKELGIDDLTEVIKEALAKQFDIPNCN